MIDSIKILNLGFLHQIAKRVFYMELKRLQTAKLVNISKANRNSLAYKARRAIYELFKVGRPISVLRVANWSGVTRQTIYSDPEIRALVEYYKNYQERHFSFSKNMPEKVLEKEKDDFRVLLSIPPIQALESNVERLIEENHKLNVELLGIKNEIFALKKGIEIEN